MKKNNKTIIRICAVVLMLVTMSMASGCNQQVFDTTWKFDRAIISLPNGEIVDGVVESWTDFEDGDQIQIKIDGKSYLTHISNVVLIAE